MNSTGFPPDKNFSRNPRIFSGSQEHYLEQRFLEHVSNFGACAALPATSPDHFFQQSLISGKKKCHALGTLLEFDTLRMYFITNLIPVTLEPPTCNLLYQIIVSGVPF